MANSRVNFLVKIPIRCWDMNKTRQGITFICRTLYVKYGPAVDTLLHDSPDFIVNWIWVGTIWWPHVSRGPDQKYHGVTSVVHWRFVKLQVFIRYTKRCGVRCTCLFQIPELCFCKVLTNLVCKLYNSITPLRTVTLAVTTRRHSTLSSSTWTTYEWWLRWLHWYVQTNTPNIDTADTLLGCLHIFIRAVEIND